MDIALYEPCMMYGVSQRYLLVPRAIFTGVLHVNKRVWACTG